MAHTEEKKLTKHVCQPGRLSLQTGILPSATGCYLHPCCGTVYYAVQGGFNF